MPREAAQGAPKLVTWLAALVCALGGASMIALYLIVVPAWEKGGIDAARAGRQAPPPPPNAVVLDSNEGDF